MSGHGVPCWYELATTDLDAASAFYSEVVGWNVVSAGMEGFDYRIASSGEGHGVAGMSRCDDPARPNWVYYLEVTSADDTTAAVREAGGHVLVEPTDIPRTGRFAMFTDPQGAAFAALEPHPVEQPEASAYDTTRTGHGGWHQLSTTDPEAAFDFYQRIFGFSQGEKMDMGEFGNYQIFGAGETDIGGMMGLLGAPAPFWLLYFNTDGVNAAIDRARAAGGTIIQGPDEVPGGAFTATIADPQGAVFGISGPR